MDVKSLKELEGKQVKPRDPTINPSKASSPQQRDVSRLSSSRLESVPKEPVEIHVEHPKGIGKHSKMRSRANEVINAVNIASEATSEIHNLARSIEGIVGQAEGHHDSEPKLKILENEANQLVAEIKKRASVSTNASLDPNEDIELEVEETLRQTLKAIFPEGADDAFGIGAVSFHPADNIISVRGSVAAARERIDVIRQSVDHLMTDVESVVDTLDVAAQNSEAALASIRDVDEALKLASDTKVGIGNNPGDALKSVGDFTHGALNLLK